MRSTPVYFAHGRTALLHGLLSFDFNENDYILVPDYICSVIPQSISKICKYIYYPISDDFTPDWRKLSELIDTRIKAIMMVHYFGQPSNIDKYVNFSRLHKLLLIEDNAHGHGGFFHGDELGTFGDIGFSSPQKILRSNSGGALYLSGSFKSAPNSLQRVKSRVIKDKVRKSLEYSPLAKKLLRMVLMSKSPDYSNLLFFTETNVNQFRADMYSEKIIKSGNWTHISKVRRKRWVQWAKFAVDNGLNPIWNKPYKESCPWAFPVYAADEQKRLFWLNWGRANGYDLFPWPSLESSVIEQSNQCVDRWKHLFCFPLHQRPPQRVYFDF